MLVTANYKLTFDTLRGELSGHDAWLLVVDTRGINVWCAAGKGTFSTEEISYQVHHARLADIVSHRTLVLPQLGAVGVSALELKASCGFKGKFGPIKASHLPDYLKHDMHAEDEMRSVTFNLQERAVLVPVEVCLLYKPLLLTLALLGILSGIGPHFFSLNAALTRETGMLWATLFGVTAGAVLTPLLLPWIPGRQFWLKGLQPGIAAALLVFMLFAPDLGTAAGIGLFLWTLAISSYLAMNFTGSTPYTSLTGVESEMRRGLPVQITCTTVGLVVWLISPFIQ